MGLGSKLAGTWRYWTAFSHMRHFRGHGIHSPFVYSLIREVFMDRRLPENKELYTLLTGHGISCRTARQIQNLHSYCNYPDFIVTDKNTERLGAIGEIEFTVVLPGTGTEILGDIFGKPRPERSTVVLTDHRSAKKMSEYADNLVTSRKYLTIDNRGYIVIFIDEKLPVQHFKI